MGGGAARHCSEQPRLQGLALPDRGRQLSGPNPPNLDFRTALVGHQEMPGHLEKWLTPGPRRKMYESLKLLAIPKPKTPEIMSEGS